MQPLPVDQLRAIADARGVTYEIPETLEAANVAPDGDGNAGEAAQPAPVKTRMSKVVPIPQDKLFEMFANPETHVKLFSIIKGSSTVPRAGIETVVPDNEFYVLEHVEEQTVTPRLMLVKYTLQPPNKIIKEGIPDPLTNTDALADRKRGVVEINFEKVDDNSTRVTTDSTFQATTGAVFMRGLVDHIWLNFYENVMVDTGEIKPEEMLTKP